MFQSENLWLEVRNFVGWQISNDFMARMPWKWKLKEEKKRFYSNNKANPMSKLYLSEEKEKYRFHIKKCQTLLIQILIYHTFQTDLT